MQATTSWEAIEELIDKLVSTNNIKANQRDAISAQVRTREKSYEGLGTGLGFGLAVPHATTNSISAPIVALGRSKNGIEWNSLDNKPVRLALLFLLPEELFIKHHHTLSEFAKLLHREELREALETAPDAATMHQAIKYYEES